MPTYLPDEAYNRLLVDLAGAFVAAATSTGHDLRDKLVEALCDAGVMPERCREDFVEDHGPEVLGS